MRTTAGRTTVTAWASLLVCAPALAVEQARQSDSFVETIGVNIHARHTWAPYSDWNGVKGAINELGIRYVRDIPDAYEKLNDLCAATGVKVCVIMQDGETTPNAINMEYLPVVLDRTRALTHIALLEGPNETDAFENWQTRMMQWQTALYSEVNADPYLAQFTMVAPSIAWYPPDYVPELYYQIDAGNMHHYQPFGPTTTHFDLRMAAARYRAREKPIYVTETGVHSATAVGGIPEPIVARYIPQGLMEFFNRDIKQSYIYELVNEGDYDNLSYGEGHFGLVHKDFTLKPVGTAIKNVISLLSDQGDAFVPAALDYTITGGDTDLHHTLLQKRDGSYYLALWQDVTLYDQPNQVALNIAPQAIQLGLPGGITEADVYLPRLSTTSTQHYSGPLTQLNLSVPDELMLVRLVAPAIARAWAVDADGGWNTGLNWVLGVPNGAGVEASFGGAISAPRTITSNGPAGTVGKMTFNSANSYHIAGTSSLTLQASSGPASMTVQQGSHLIDLPVSFASNTTIDVAAGAALTLGGAVTVQAGRSVAQSGAGALNLQSSVMLEHDASLTVSSSQHVPLLDVGDNATVTLAAQGSRVLRADNVVISSTAGKIDLRNNKLVTALPAGTFVAGDYSGIAKLVKSARGAGAWDGIGGITTSTTDAINGITTLAVARADEVGQSAFGGDTVVMYTLNGDANLSGALDADDYFAIDSNLSRSGSVFGFTRGDFNYDGSIDGDDYMLIDMAYSAQAGGFSLSPSAGVTTVPEPASVGLIVLPLLRARRRR